MNRFRRLAFASSCIIFIFALNNTQGQNPSAYIVKSGKEIISLVPRPDLGFVIQSDEQDPEIQAYGDMLSSLDTINIRKIRGLNKRSYSVLINDSSGEERTNAFELMQSRNQAKYRAPLLTINDQTVAIIPEIVVRLAFEDAKDDLLALCERLDLTIKQKMEFTQKEYLLEVHGTDEKSVFEAIADLEQAQFIEWAAPNIASQPFFSGFVAADNEETEQVLPNDEYFSQLWHLYNSGQTGGTPHADINAPEAWKVTSGDPNIVIAIIDSGVDINHPDLINNLVSGYDFVDDDNDPSPSLENPDDAHGTMCAGLAAARGNNNIGVCGVAWNSKIMPIRIADEDNFITDADIATAFRWAASHGADILSNSWGGYYPSQIIYSAILDVTEQNGIGRSGKGCIVCCAAGNWEDGGPVLYPAARPEVIAVGATDHEDVVWYYSASGPELDIVAPSGSSREDFFFQGKPFTWTTDISGIYGYSIYNLDYRIWDYSDSMSGTSGACPLVAGVAGLVLSVDPNLRNVEVQRILLDTSVDLGEPGKDEYYGFGRVDANAAVHLALNPPSTPPSSMITLYVDDNAPDDPGWGDPEFSDPNEDGTYRHPFDSIQKAVDFALYSETIIVLDGTYTGNGNCEIDFLGKPLRVLSETGPESCIIDCQDSGRGFYLHNNESSEAQIEGFKIINGMAYDGAGIYCSNGSSPSITNCIISNCWAYSWGLLGGEGGGIFTDSSCNPTLTDCTFSQNRASWDGGGVSIYYGNPILNNCKFERNMAGDWGGGLCNNYGSPTLTDCNFSENSALTYGGGLFNEEGYPVLKNCTFIKNDAIEYDGGGIYNDYGDLIIENCNFINNSATDWGAGFYTLDSFGTTLTNCLFYANTAGSEGGAIYSDESIATITNCTFASNNASDGNAIACDSWWFGSELEISNCIIWDGLSSIWNNDSSSITISYSDVKKSGTNAWQGIGNINTDPEFADPDNGDCHLKSQAGRWDPVSETWVIDDITTSLCIDAGDPASDFSKEPAPNGSRINMGAFGGTSQASKSASSL
jgi:predicted outer membrane repeat protein